MGDWRTLVVAGAAVLIGLGCTTLPGVLAWVAAGVRRRPRPAVLGPLFWNDLVALARRGQHLRLRPAFTAVLLGGLFVTYLDQFREVNPLLLVTGIDRTFPLDRMSAFGQRFLTIYLYCQLAAVVLVTPVIAGGAVCGERDRGTLDHLRTSLLTNRELIASYLTARLAFIFGLMLTGLPVLGVTMMFGGVDGDILVAGTTIAGMTALSLGTFALYLGLTKPTMREVLFWSYGAVLVGSVLSWCCMCCSCLPMVVASPFTATFLILSDLTFLPGRFTWLDIPNLTGAYVLVHGLLAGLFTWRATAQVRVPPPVWRKAVGRARKVRDADDDEPSAKPNVVYQDTRPRTRARPPLREFAVPRLGPADPLLWKERFFSGRLGGAERGLATGCGAVFVGLIALPVGLTLFVAIARSLEQGHDISTTMNPLLRWCAVLATTVIAPLTGFWAVSSVTRERERQTLDALFTLPVTRAEILLAKWKAAAYLVRYWLLALAGLAGLAVLSWSVHPLALVSGTVVVVGFVAFTTTLAVWLSVRCRTSTRAASWYVGLLLAMSVLPFPIATLAGSGADLVGSGLRESLEEAIRCGSVPYATYQAFQDWTGFHADGWAPVIGAAVSGLVYAVLALILWRDAVEWFEGDGR